MGYVVTQCDMWWLSVRCGGSVGYVVAQDRVMVVPWEM
jgi:hypothetical protein